MSFLRYPKYKDSGVEWLGAVPNHWDVRKVRWLCRIRKRIAGELGHDVLSITQQGLKVKDLESNDGQLSMDYSKYQFVEIGDFAMNHMDLLTGYVDISNSRGVTSPDYRVFEVRDRDVCDDKYLLYLFQMGYKNKIFFAYGQGSSQLGRWRLPTEQFNDLLFPLPPKSEQRDIAYFLAKETAKIDELVEEQQELIDLLKVKRQAVISHAVTKGLSPDASMKPSNIEWLGDVPAHWEVGPLKRYWSAIDCKHVTAEFVSEGIPVASIREVQGRWVSLEKAKRTTEHFYELLVEGGRRPWAGDLIFSRNATVGEVAQVNVDHPRFAMGQDVVLLRKLLPNYSSDYLQYVIRSPIVIQQLDVLMIGSTFKRINVDEIRSLVVLSPPAAEQIAIARFLEQEVQRFDVLIAAAQHAIGLLHERRTALISAAVTGQIDVREKAKESLAALKPYSRGFARQLLAAEILSRCHQYPTTGRVKLQKLIHLCEHVAEIEEVDADYFRKAAGPFDNQLMFGIAAGLSKQKWFAEVKNGDRSVYKPLEKAGEHAKYLARWQSKMPKIRKVLHLLGRAETQQCEIVSTLYAAWNDLLIDGKTPSDMEIVQEASDPERWHKNKLNIPSGKWPIALSWMREKGLVPSGFGTHTRRPLPVKYSA